MSVQIPDAAIEAVFERVKFHFELSDFPEDQVRDVLTMALGAAAPYIRAQALEDVAVELDGADRVTRERDGCAASISLPNAATYLRRHAVTHRPNL